MAQADGEKQPLLNGMKKEVSYSWLPVFFVNIFFACVSFSIIMPSLAPYLEQIHGDLSFLPWVVAIYSVGEMIGSVAFGRMYNELLERLPGGQGPRVAMISCILVGAVGSAIYAAADWCESPWMVFWARAIQGLWTGGQQTIEQAYLSAAVEPERRTELTATLSTYVVLGFIMGPCFGAAFTAIGSDGFSVFGIDVDMYNAPGFFILLVTLVMALVTSLCFAGEVRNDARSVSADDMSSPTGGAKRSVIGLAVCLWIFFVHFYSFAVQETITTPLAMRIYDWTPLEVDLLFVGAGVLSLFSALCVKFLTRQFEDQTLLLFSLVVGIAGSVLLIDIPSSWEEQAGDAGDAADDPRTTLSLWRFLIGFALITIAFPFGRNVTLGVFSNVLGPGPQGVWMGIMLAVGAIPRTLGPFSAVWLLDVVDWQTYLDFGVSTVLFVSALVVAVLFLKELTPASDADRMAKPILRPYPARRYAGPVQSKQK